MHASAPTVELTHVSRWYGPVIGLNDVSLELYPGVTGLLGPNGAGKSTLLKLVTGQLRPSQGSVRAFSAPVFANPRVLSRLGVCPDFEELYEHRTALEHVRMLLELGGFSTADAGRRSEEALRRVGLSAGDPRRVGAFSKGMRQRLRLAMATAHDPLLIVLDEPLTGMDPVGRHEMIELIKSLAGQGRTVLVSGHVLYEVEKMTRRIVLIHHGRVLAEGTLAEIRAALERRPHHVRVSCQEPRSLARQLLAEPGVVSVELEEAAATFEIVKPDAFFTRLQRLAAEGGVQAYETTDDNLQAIFDYLVA